jgi:hypothetical protein
MGTKTEHAAETLLASWERTYRASKAAIKAHAAVTADYRARRCDDAAFVASRAACDLAVREWDHVDMAYRVELERAEAKGAAHGS